MGISSTNSLGACIECVFPQNLLGPFLSRRYSLASFRLDCLSHCHVCFLTKARPTSAAGSGSGFLETDPAKILSSSQGRTMFLPACPAAASWTCSVAAPSFCLRLDPLPSPNADLLLTWAQPICDRASCFFATRHRAQRKRLVHPQPVQRPF